MARNGCSSPPRSRRWLEMVARARPGAANTRKVPLESAPEPQNARRVPLESAPERQNARRVPLEPPRRRKMSTSASRACPGVTACSKSAAQAHSREVRNGRSKRAGPCSSFIGISFCSAPLCFVHVMHGFTLVLYIYTYIWPCLFLIRHYNLVETAHHGTF